MSYQPGVRVTVIVKLKNIIHLIRLLQKMNKTKKGRPRVRVRTKGNSNSQKQSN